MNQEDDLRMFTSYLPNLRPPERLDLASSRGCSDFFSAWFDTYDYDMNRFRFESIAEDGAGGHFAVWYRPDSDGPLPLVFFDSEGGYCVLAKSAWDWPLIMAYGVSSDEYDVYDEERNGAVAVDPTKNEWLPHPGSLTPYIGDEWNIAAHKSYRVAVEAKYGTIPPLEELIAGRDELSAELHEWIQNNRQK